MTACLSSLSRQDALNIWGMITFFGGECTLSLEDACSHLVTGLPQGVSVPIIYTQSGILEGFIMKIPNSHFRNGGIKIKFSKLSIV